ncbi:MerR family transcriptional regulator [Bacillus sp. JCM 19034]|uniref:MerR family transcriptional regulator n=1 Tax=Bacillus sp. JCM 19034 TaxID=1481928 RepID=UPI0007812AE3|nr:MerR family transcriptional regulator [Bacillus sp. JCM 19034]
MENQEQTFTISEFGRRARITVRTLRFYEELGLLVPSRQNHLGHRIYGLGELAKLQQIQSLKFLGYSLQEIKSLLQSESKSVEHLEQSLPLQLKMLMEKRDELNRAIDAVKRVQLLIKEGKPLTWTVLSSLLYQMEHEDDQKEWMKEYFSEEVVEQFYSLSKEQRQQIDIEILDILEKVKKLMKEGVPPQSPQAFDLLAKLTDLALKHVDDPEEFAKQLEQVDDIQNSEELNFQFPTFFNSEEEAYILEIGKSMEALYNESKEN